MRDLAPFPTSARWRNGDGVTSVTTRTSMMPFAGGRKTQLGLVSPAPADVGCSALIAVACQSESGFSAVAGDLGVEAHSDFWLF